MCQIQRIEQATMYRSNPELFVQRMQKALEEVKKFEDVDSENIAVIGYCFGGKIAASVSLVTSTVFHSLYLTHLF